MKLILTKKRTMTVEEDASVSKEQSKSLKIQHDDSEEDQEESLIVSCTNSNSSSSTYTTSSFSSRHSHKSATDQHKDEPQEQTTTSTRSSSPCPSNQTEHDDISNEEEQDQQKSNKDIERTLSQLDPHKSDACKGMSPDLYIQKLFGVLLGFSPLSRPTLELSSLSYNETNVPFISPITEEDMANYDVDVVTATREEELETLRSMHAQGRTLSCCNRYGESLLHMACRRGFTDIVRFLVQEANVQIRVTDDCGRTPMHDALWNRDCQFGIVDLLLNLDPSLFLLCDKHGHTPFMYARREHWDVWKQFLWDRREYIRNAMDSDVMNLFKIDL